MLVISVLGNVLNQFISPNKIKIYICGTNRVRTRNLISTFRVRTR